MKKIEICDGRSCRLFGAEKLIEDIQAHYDTLDEDNKREIHIETCQCMGHCATSPNVMIDDELIPDAKGEDVWNHPLLTD